MGERCCAVGRRSLAFQIAYIGWSSWKYQRWLDQVYTRTRYMTRSRFSKEPFEETCLREYASANLFAVWRQQAQEGLLKQNRIEEGRVHRAPILPLIAA